MTMSRLVMSEESSLASGAWNFAKHWPARRRPCPSPSRLATTSHSPLTQRKRPRPLKPGKSALLPRRGTVWEDNSFLLSKTNYKMKHLNNLLIFLLFRMSMTHKMWLLHKRMTFVQTHLGVTNMITSQKLAVVWRYICANSTRFPNLMVGMKSCRGISVINLKNQ